MIENHQGADISFGNNKSDKINLNNQSVAVASVDMSKILPQIEEEQKESSKYGSSMSINAEIRNNGRVHTSGTDNYVYGDIEIEE